MCGSGLKTVIMGSEQIKAKTNNILVAGGMESMTNAPYLSKNNRDGARIGHVKMYDHMFLDGLEDAYEEGRLMGSFAEDCARNYQFTRIQQDEYAIKSLENALNAQKMVFLSMRLYLLRSKKNKEEILITEDQQPKRSNALKIPKLKPAFLSDGTVTAANSSSISDGAAALLICSENMHKEKI